jgi:high-affinity K+ transport system ATPase subunit B
MTDHYITKKEALEALDIMNTSKSRGSYYSSAVYVALLIPILVLLFLVLFPFFLVEFAIRDLNKGNKNENNK